MISLDNLTKINVRRLSEVLNALPKDVRSVVEVDLTSMSSPQSNRPDLETEIIGELSTELHEAQNLAPPESNVEEWQSEELDELESITSQHAVSLGKKSRRKRMGAFSEAYEFAKGVGVRVVAEIFKQGLF